MKQDKFLLGILIFIGLLVVTAVVLFFVRNEAPVYGAENTPEGVVHNYIVAFQQNDLDRAYTYLAEGQNKPILQGFRQRFTQNYNNPFNYAVDIGEAKISGDTAQVELTITFVSSGPFQGDQGSENDLATLSLQAGSWKITSMPYQFWDSSWYLTQK